MSDMFRVSTTDLIRLQKKLRKDPIAFKKASASLLTSFAFGTRTESVRVFKTKFTVRNERFVKGKLRVEKASPKDDIDKQRSVAGSISGPRFSGWAEQELGTTTKRTRVGNRFGRRKDWSKQLEGRARLKPNQNFPDPEDFNIKAKNETHRLTVFLLILNRQKRKQSFIIPKKFNKFKKGLYRFKGKRIQRLQNFEPKKVQPKRIRWLTQARENFFSGANIPRMWEKAISRFFR